MVSHWLGTLGLALILHQAWLQSLLMLNSQDQDQLQNGLILYLTHFFSKMASNFTEIDLALALSCLKSGWTVNGRTEHVSLHNKIRCSWITIVGHGVSWIVPKIWSMHCNPSWISHVILFHRLNSRAWQYEHGQMTSSIPRMIPNDGMMFKDSLKILKKRRNQRVGPYSRPGKLLHSIHFLLAQDSINSRLPALLSICSAKLPSQ